MKRPAEWSTLYNCIVYISRSFSLSLSKSEYWQLLPGFNDMHKRRSFPRNKFVRDNTSAVAVLNWCHEKASSTLPDGRVRYVLGLLIDTHTQPQLFNRRQYVKRRVGAALLLWLSIKVSAKIRFQNVSFQEIKTVTKGKERSLPTAIRTGNKFVFGQCLITIILYE